MDIHSDDLYSLRYPSPVNPDELNNVTLVIALQGYADAGMSVESASSHLLAALEHDEIACFSLDELIDYRSRRPQVAFADGVIAGIDPLHLSLSAVHDLDGKTFLLLSGPEPDFRWNLFATAIGDLVKKFHVGTTVCLYSAAMMVPHTRPLLVSAHGAARYQGDGFLGENSHLAVPGAAALMAEYALTSEGFSCGGFTSWVPHYLASRPYPEATLELLTRVAALGELNLPLGALEKDVARFVADTSDSLIDSSEQSRMLTLLEQQYDEQAGQRRRKHSEATVPSDDEIAQEVETFLTEISAPDADPPSSGGRTSSSVAAVSDASGEPVGEQCAVPEVADEDLHSHNGDQHDKHHGIVDTPDNDTSSPETPPHDVAETDAQGLDSSDDAASSNGHPGDEATADRRDPTGGPPGDSANPRIISSPKTRDDAKPVSGNDTQSPGKTASSPRRWWRGLLGGS